MSQLPTEHELLSSLQDEVKFYIAVAEGTRQANAEFGRLLTHARNLLEEVEANGRPHGTSPNTGPCECDHCQTYDSIVKYVKSY